MEAFDELKIQKHSVWYDIENKMTRSISRNGKFFVD